MKKYLLGVIAFFALDSVCASERPVVPVVQVGKFECRQYREGYILVVESKGQGAQVYTIVAKRGAENMDIYKTTEDGPVRVEAVCNAVSYNRLNKLIDFKGPDKNTVFKLHFGAFEPPLDGGGFRPAREVPYRNEHRFDSYFARANARFKLDGQPWSCNIL